MCLYKKGCKNVNNVNFSILYLWSLLLVIISKIWNKNYFHFPWIQQLFIFFYQNHIVFVFTLIILILVPLKYSYTINIVVLVYANDIILKKSLHFFSLSSANLEYNKIMWLLLLQEDCQNQSFGDELKGSLNFSISYDTNLQLITVCLKQACDLVPRQFSGTADPYAKVKQLNINQQTFAMFTNIWQTNVTIDERDCSKFWLSFNLACFYKD